MTAYIPIPLMIAYSLFTFFSYYQTLHVRDFRGASRRFVISLMYFNFATLLFGLGFLIYYGFAVVWWAPIILVVIGLLSFIPLVFVEGIIPAWVLSLLGFVIVPICGVLMIYFLPNTH